jgi:hypothetical protein
LLTQLGRNRLRTNVELAMTSFQIVRPSDAPSRDLATESRDTERAIRLWHEKASSSRPPDLSAFDFHRFQTDWGYRFVISGQDEFLAAAVFLLYGKPFAHVLSLPDKPNPFVPALEQLPARYRDLFVEGCTEALLELTPARFSGAVRHGCDAELYRAAFMPLQAGPNLRPLVYGTFNRRTMPLTALRGISGPDRSQAGRLPAEQILAELDG